MRCLSGHIECSWAETFDRGVEKGVAIGLEDAAQAVEEAAGTPNSPFIRLAARIRFLAKHRSAPSPRAEEKGGGR